MSSIGACRAWKILKRLNGLHEQQTNIKFFLLLGKCSDGDVSGGMESI